jgi:hypothetical protein
MATEEVASATARVTTMHGHHTVDHEGDSFASHTTHTTTPHFVITYSSSLGADGSRFAQLVAGVCEGDYTKLQAYFGGITPASLPFQVRLTPGRNGASHATCQATALMIGARSAPAGDQDFINALVVAEEDEVFMGNFGNGWDCGASNGEGLSRVLSNDLHPNTEPAGFVSAPVWLDTPSRPDWVNHTEPTDIDFVSIGCSVLFLNWLHTQLKHSWHDIIQAGGPTLADSYRNLGEPGDGYARFRQLIDSKFPLGQPSGLRTDNPFPL